MRHNPIPLLARIAAIAHLFTATAFGLAGLLTVGAPSGSGILGGSRCDRCGHLRSHDRFLHGIAFYAFTRLEKGAGREIVVLCRQGRYGAQKKLEGLGVKPCVTRSN